jgi:hypothetical protein
MSGEVAIKQSMVRILDATREVRGCGLLVDPHHIVTCAHVVAFALGIEATQTEMPRGSVIADFPHNMPSSGAMADVVAWKPVTKETPPDRLEDIAVLKLHRPVPFAGEILAKADFGDYNYKAHGFTKAQPHGSWVDGHFKGENDDGWILMQSADSTDLQVAEGFSGGGVWVSDLGAFGGIMVANQERGGQRKPVSYIISGSLIHRVLREVDGFRTPSGGQPIPDERAEIVGAENANAALLAFGRFRGRPITVKDLVHRVLATYPIPKEYEVIDGFANVFSDAVWDVCIGEKDKEEFIAALRDELSPNKAKSLFFHFKKWVKDL